MAIDVSVVILPEHRWAQARPRWQEAEARGFRTAWTYDHLTWRSLRDGPWLSPLPLLTAVATATSALRIGLGDVRTDRGGRVTAGVVRRSRPAGRRADRGLRVRGP
jgi:hypothetical protein